MYKNAFGYYSFFYIYFFTILYATLLSLSTTITIFCFPFNEQQLLHYSSSLIYTYTFNTKNNWISILWVYRYKWKEEEKIVEEYKSISFMDRKHERYFILFLVNCASVWWLWVLFVCAVCYSVLLFFKSDRRRKGKLEESIYGNWEGAKKIDRIIYW